MSVDAAPAINRNLGGILMMLCAVGLLSLMDAGLKELAARYPPFQLGALRALASLPWVIAWIALTGGYRALLRVRWPLHLLRGVVGVGMMATFVYALSQLPLTTAYTLFFVAPLFITLLSVLLLGERVGRGRWLAIAVGFAGVLVAMRPTGEGVLSWSGLAVLAAAAGYALSAITVRILGRTDSTQAMVFWLLVIMGLGSSAIAAPGWVTLRPEDYRLVAGVGVVGVLGQFAITEAFRRGEASVVAPMEYSALAWALGFDALLWGVLPGLSTWVGAAIIVGSGLYLLQQEHRVGRAMARPVVQTSGSSTGSSS
jgi:drug/metabolite transporter (DMT)-like permease